MLLPYYARTLERIRAEDLDLSYRQMAEALGTTASAGALTRADGARVDHTTLRAIEMGRNWPRDPDAWAAAYGELIGWSGWQVWVEAMREYGAAVMGEDLTLRRDWRERVDGAIEELDRRAAALRGAAVVLPDQREWFEILLRVTQGGELPPWEGPPLPDLMP